MKTETHAPFQILPPLSDEDYLALKADIAERGMQVPVEKDEDGNTIDGHHRERAALELGITDYPITVRHYANEAAKRTQARKLNIARRHLGTADKRVLIEQELKENSARSNRQIADDLGVDHVTVGTARKKLEGGGEIHHHDTHVGRDGVAQPASKPARPGGVKSTPPDKSSVEACSRAKHAPQPEPVLSENDSCRFPIKFPDDPNTEPNANEIADNIIARLPDYTLHDVVRRLNKYIGGYSVENFCMQIPDLDWWAVAHCPFVHPDGTKCDGQLLLVQTPGHEADEPKLIGYREESGPWTYTYGKARVSCSHGGRHELDCFEFDGTPDGTFQTFSVPNRGLLVLAARRPTATAQVSEAAE